jgi:Fe-S-cluster containining protein
MKFFWLNFHTPYACRDSGMCCSSGWPIPVERARVPAIEQAIAGKVIPLRVEPWLTPDQDAPDDTAGVLSLRDNGHCVFFEAGRSGCAIHDVKPAACVHFPYACLIDQRGASVTLSHYCPTAVSLLFEHRDPIAIVEGPPPIGGPDDLEGLDARDSLPPVSSDGKRLLSFDELSAWERDQIVHARIGDLHADDVMLFDRARAAVPAPWAWPEAPDHLDGVWYTLVAPRWARFDDVLDRYAAAKVFASWSLYLGNGLEAAAQTARIAAAVLRIEAARQCLITGRLFDRELLTEAIRQSDLLLVHYADPSLLAAAAAPADRPPE